MKRFLISILLAVCFASCKTTSPVVQVPVKTETIIKERLIPVELVKDSALVQMLIECDSNNNAIVTRLNQLQTSGVKINLKQDLNAFQIRFETIRDTAYVIVTDTVTITEKPIIVEKPVVEYKQRGWQSWFMWTGITATALMGVWITMKFIKK